MNMDILIVSFWSVTYVLILVNQISTFGGQKVFIPFIAVSLNVAWEINAAVQSHGFWGHLLWLGLDTLIFFFTAITIWRKERKNILYPIVYFLITILLTHVFYYLFLIDYGMLLLSFLSNVPMSIAYIAQRKSISYEFRTTIATLKMLGTMCATIGYGTNYPIILGLGIVIFFIDLFYLSCCLEMTATKRKRRR